MAKNPTGSPVSDGGRGLKHPHSRSDRAGYLGSPVSDGGRGLKLLPVRPGSLGGGIRLSRMTVSRGRGQLP